jgi:hypothetical protein
VTQGHSASCCCENMPVILFVPQRFLLPPPHCSSLPVTTACRQLVLASAECTVVEQDQEITSMYMWCHSDTA